MPENFRFKSEVTYDLPTYKEFDRYASAVNPITVASKVVLILCFTYLLTQLFDSFAAFATLFCIAALLLIQLITYLIKRKGSIHYKRQLEANQGKPAHLTVYFCDDGIQLFDEKNIPSGSFNYDQIRSVIETPNLLILMMKYRTGIMLRKDMLVNGSREGLISHLAWNCHNWKNGKILTGKVSKILGWILLGLLVLSLILAVCNLPSVRLFDKPTGTLTNDMTYQEMADQLAPLGITISQQAIAELEQIDADYEEEFGEEYYSGFFAGSKIYDLLYWEAAGFYDEETWEWTPSQSGLYYFDAEVMNVDRIYTDFFTGLQAMHTELVFADITEDYSNADLENGTGEVQVSFLYHDQRYTFTAEYYYDWLDASIVYEVGEILAADNREQNLYIYYEDQGGLLYYGTAEQAAQLKILTGLDFELVSDS